MTERRPTLRCPCGERETDVLFSYDRPPAGEVLKSADDRYDRAYDQCRACGHCFARYRMSFDPDYSGGYVDVAYGGADAARRDFRRIIALPPERSDNYGRAERVCAFLADRAPSGRAPRLLDVGAGLGVFPAAMVRRGWSVVAFDPDPRNAAHYRDEAGAEPRIGDFLTDDLDGLQGFDLMTFNKVLEHVPDPAAMLARARALAPDRLYIELPDVAAASDDDGPAREEFGLGHDHVFSTASVAMLLQRNGFSPLRIDRIREPSGKYTLYAFAGLV
jgi:SAM-dependent methyltransferase